LILNLKDEENPIDEISRIEVQLEELAEVSERCRKIILVSKAAIAGGAALLLFMMVGLFGSNQVAAIGSIAVVLGGIVSLGSNVSTLRQTIAAMSAVEARRSDLISRIDLRVVGDKTMKRIWRSGDQNAMTGGGILRKPMSAFEVRADTGTPSTDGRKWPLNGHGQLVGLTSLLGWVE
jgi:hypothetical protein